MALYIITLLFQGSSGQQATTPQKYGQQNDSFFGGVNDAGLTGQNKVVFNYISACTAEQGISITELRNKNRNMNDQQLR